MKKLIVVSALSLSACMSSGELKEPPPLHENHFTGDHTGLASCVIERLQADSRWPIRMLRFSSRVEPAGQVSTLYAYDARLLPGTFARNAPTNPDAVPDYSDPYPDMDFRDKHGFYTGPRYVFSLRIRQTGDASVTATLRGVTRAGDIAWERLQDCATTQTRF